MARSIQKVAVLGSGVMGSRIACHFANAGLEVLLLDILPPDVPEDAEKGDSGALLSRNAVAVKSLEAAIRSSPSPLFLPEYARRITPGNFQDNMKDIASCDWILEAVVEDLAIKRQVWETVEQHRKPGTLVTTNTSGIPVHLLAQDRSPDFRAHFCGTHFFNPPRYLRLLEIIPSPDTDPEIVAFLMDYGDRFLGKRTVLCKDTPAFIANRIGVFSFMAVFRVMEELGLGIDDVDVLTGPAMGHPKSATFRTADVVGIDTLLKVARDLVARRPDDEAGEIFRVPDFVEKLAASGRQGDKTGAGFYKKEKGPSGTVILTLDPVTLEYGPRSKPRFPVLDRARQLEEIRDRLPVLLEGDGKAEAFYRAFHYLLFSYAAHRIPEIADEPYQIDEAMKAGFGWELGPFEAWDALGVRKTVQRMQAAGYVVPAWVSDMLGAGRETFYRVEAGKRLCYDPAAGGYKQAGEAPGMLLLGNFSGNLVWSRGPAKLYDIGDGVACFSWKTKMNTIGGEVLTGLAQAVETAEQRFGGLVIANEGPVFSAGANVGLIFMLAAEQEWDELHLAVKTFQQAHMRLRYSTVPVVAAPAGLTLGGGCELCLHASRVQAAAETYMGLVELGVGLIPAGGGTTALTRRAGEAYREGQLPLPALRSAFMTIATAKVSGSAAEASELDLLRPGYDRITMQASRVIAEAKKTARSLAEGGYSVPEKKKIRVLGRESLGAFLAGIYSMGLAGRATEYDQQIATKLAWVMSGGNLSQPTWVEEDYLLDLEREAFVSLCGEPKTLARLEGLLKTGKPVRN